MPFTTTATTYQGQSGRATKALSHFLTRSAALWTIQCLLAATFLFAGASKLAMSGDTLDEQSTLPVLFLRFIGVCETLGAVGLILPALFSVRPALTPLAAVGLAIIMAGATVVTVAAGDVAPALVPFVIGVLCAVVAVKRSESAR